MKFVIGENRCVVVKGYDIEIRDEKTDKCATLNVQRFVKIRENLAEIKKAVAALRNKEDVHYRQHIGGTWYVSVTSGVWCVDVRRFYNKSKIAYDVDVRPTRQGIGLRLREWDSFVEIMAKIEEERPDIQKEEPCYYQGDHQNQEGKTTTIVIH